MMNSKLHRQYRSNWLRKVRYQSIVTTERELRAMLIYSFTLLVSRILTKISDKSRTNK